MLALTINGATENVADDSKEEAMKRYWEARQQGDRSARLVVVEKPPETDPDPPPCPTAPGVISKVAVERLERQEEWLKTAGFQVPPPIYAPGTRVKPLGDRNFKLERQRVEDMPRFPDAANRVIQAIANERRADLRVELGDIRMGVDGTILVDDQELGLEVDAFQQLAVTAGFGMGTKYLTTACDAKLRAVNVNEQLDGRRREAVLRVREDGEGQRSVYAIVTPTYSVVDTDHVLQEVADELKDAHTELVYDGNGIKATALFMPDEVVDLAAGDIFKVGVRIETDDTGRGRVRVTAVVFRNRCLNLILIGEGAVETVSAVHKGDREKILTTVKEGVTKAREAVGPFLEAWGHARTVVVDIPATFRAWVEEKKISARGAKERDQVVEVLLAAWHKEPGNTLADAVNAATRAAHEAEGFGADWAEEIEKLAARAILVPR